MRGHAGTVGLVVLMAAAAALGAYSATRNPTITRFVALAGGRPGSFASVVVQTRPGTPCSISYATPQGTLSQAQGLFPKTADVTGRASWAWQITSSTPPGAGRIGVTCGGEMITGVIQIG